MNICDRLKQERERIGLSQVEFGQMGGAGRTTVIAWERGTAFPNAAFLALAAARGVDVRYVITGSRDYAPPPPLSAEEQTLIDRWREASREVKNAAMGALLGASAGRHTHQVISGKVGQVVSGHARMRDVSIQLHDERRPYGPTAKRPPKKP